MSATAVLELLYVMAFTPDVAEVAPGAYAASPYVFVLLDANEID